MALEKLWREILPINIVGLGPRIGSLLVQDSTEFRVGMEVTLKSPTNPSLVVEIKSINKNVIYFGKIGVQNQTPQDVSLYFPGTIQSPEQNKKAVPEQDQSFDRYERGPVNADRTVLVDKKGEFYDKTNPLDVKISDVEVTANLFVQLTHKDNLPNPGDIADSVRIGDGVDELKINSDGSINSIVSATDLDIRNLSAIQDNIAISDGINTATVTTGKALKVDGSAVTQPITGTITANQGTTPWIVSGNVVSVPSPTSVDAFGRSRVSELFTLGDYKHIYDLDPNFLDYSILGATVSFTANKSCATLTTSSDPGSSITHQTKFYHHYQPGKSQFILSSVCFGYAQQNVTKRTGYFDDRDGIYFEQVGSNLSNGTNNGELNFVIRSFVGGSPSESPIGSYLRRVPQNLWNIDKCDGTGDSGFNINTSKTQLVYIDFQWLGVGRVRVGFVHNGQIIIAHEYYHSNILDVVYLSNPNLPVRCKMFNTGATSGGSMDQICSTVASEGGYVESGIDWSITTGLRSTTSPGGTELPLVAIRLKNSFKGYPNRMSIRPNNFSLLVETNSIEYSIIKLPNASSLSTTLNGGTLTWVSADNDSGVEYCANATAYVTANADKFFSGFAPSGSSQNSLSPAASGSLTSAKKNIISQNYDSTNSEVYVVVVKTINTGAGTTANVAAAIQWREIY